MIEALRAELLKREIQRRNLSKPPELSPHPHALGMPHKPRITATYETVSAGKVIGPGISPEMIVAEQKRLGVKQLSARELVGLHKRLMGDVPGPSPIQVVQDAGATLTHVRNPYGRIFR